MVSPFAILADEDEDEELEFEAPPDLEMRKTAGSTACAGVQRLLCHAEDQEGQVGGDLDSGPKESVRPVSLNTHAHF